MFDPSNSSAPPFTHTASGAASFLSAAKGMAFDGASGHLSFSSVGARSGRFDVVNVQGSSFVRVLTADESGALSPVAGATIMYMGGVSSPPLDTRNAVIKFLSQGIQTVNRVAFALSAVACFFAAAIIFFFRQRQAFVVGSPVFMGMVVFGSSLVSVAILTVPAVQSTTVDDKFLLDPTESRDDAGQRASVCALTAWTWNLGHTIIVSALFVKVAFLILLSAIFIPILRLSLSIFESCCL